MTLDLFGADDAPRWSETLAPGAVVLRGFALAQAADVLAEIEAISQVAPFRHMKTPGGRSMSAAMSNCGALGWVTDETGYRYSANDPLTNRPWPAMPAGFHLLAQRAAHAAGFARFSADACLINRYEIGARMALHKDRDERDFTQPIVSVSLGLPMVFQFGGMRRSDAVRRVTLTHGDVLVWGGESRLRFHGVLALKAGDAPEGCPAGVRINLTLRKAG